MTERQFRRWRPAAALGLGFAGLGLAASSPALLLGGAVGLAAAGYGRAGSAPDPDLAVERSFDPEDPAPGEEIEVSVTVRNEGDGVLPELLVGDRLPPGVTTVDGSPRHGTALGPGDATEFGYAVEAAIGVHEVGPVEALARDASGSAERSVTAGEPSTLRVDPPQEASVDLPLRAATTPYVGSLPIDEGGSGLEFHSVREYRTGDPLKRIHWSHLAATGELATREFRVERAASVVLVVDARAPTRVADPDGRPTFGRTLAATSALTGGLIDQGHRVGLAALGPVPTWIGTGADRLQRRRIDRALTTDPAFEHAPPERSFSPKIRLRWLQGRIPADAQLVIVSPLVDDQGAALARRLATLSPATVLSPDPTPAEDSGGNERTERAEERMKQRDDAGDATTEAVDGAAEASPGARLERIRREARVDAVRSAGVPVVDWEHEEPLSLAAARARRWSG